MEAENVVFGVYFGNTSFCVAIGKDSKPEIVTNDCGERVTAAALFVDNEEKLLGQAAKQNFARKAENTVLYNKYFLGLDSSGLEELKNNFYKGKLFTAAKVEHHKESLVYKIQRSSISPFDVLCEIYKRANDIAKRHVKSSQKDFSTVISVPYNFDESKRSLVKKAANAAGFNVLRVISEISAAMYAYDLGQDDNSETFYCLICHIGGQSTTMSIARVVGGLYQIIWEKQNLDFGGDAITDLLLKSCAKEFVSQWKLDPLKSHRSRMKLFIACEDCKHILSNQGSAQCYVESLCDGVDYQTTISRAKLEMLISPLLLKLKEDLKSVLDECALDTSSIRKVVLTGGSTKIPVVQTVFLSMFPDCTLLSSISPDEVHAYGCAKECLLLQGMSTQQQSVKSHVSALDKEIAFKVADSFISVLHKYTPVPARRSITIPHESGPNVVVEVYEVSDSEQQHFLSKIELGDLEDKCDITARLSLTSDGSLHITLFDSISQKTSAITIEGVDQNDVNEEIESDNLCDSSR